MKEIVEKRIHPDIVVSEVLFAEGLFDTVGFLYSELKAALEEENRFFGIVKSYALSIDQAFYRFNSSTNEDDIEIYGRILYLCKPSFLSEFKKLRNKRLTAGDCLIVIINKLLEVISNVEGFSHKKELKTVRKIFTKLFDNIKNKNKKDSMYSLFNTIKELMSRGAVGKYISEDINFSDIYKQKNDILTGSGIRVNDESDTKVIEVTWIGD